MIEKEPFREFIKPAKEEKGPEMIEEKEKGETPEKDLEEKEKLGRQIFHVSGWEKLAVKEVGDSFILRPGPKGAEGKGVYFSEKQPRFSAAEGTRGKPPTVVVIEVTSSKDWWRSKGYVERKFQRPRTWHSQEKSLECKVKETKMIEGVQHLFCEWKWCEEE